MGKPKKPPICPTAVVSMLRMHVDGQSPLQISDTVKRDRTEVEDALNGARVFAGSVRITAEQALHLAEVASRRNMHPKRLGALALKRIIDRNLIEDVLGGADD